MADIFNEIINNSTRTPSPDEVRTSPQKMYINAKERISFVRDRIFYNKMPEFKDLKPGDWLLCYNNRTGYEFNGKTWELEAIIKSNNEDEKIILFSHINGIPVTDINYSAIYDELKTLNVPDSILKEIRKNNPEISLNDYLYTDSVEFKIVDKEINCITAEKQSNLSSFFGEENEIEEVFFKNSDSLGMGFFDD